MTATLFLGKGVGITQNRNTPEALQAIQIREQQEAERLEKLGEVKREQQSLAAERQETCSIITKTQRLKDHNQTITLEGNSQDPNFLKNNAAGIDQQVGELKEIQTATRQVGRSR